MRSSFLEDGMLIGSRHRLDGGQVRRSPGPARRRKPVSRLTCVATSEGTREFRPSVWALTLSTLDERAVPRSDRSMVPMSSTTDLQAHQGRRGRLLREKIVATASERMVVDRRCLKRVDRLGRFPLPSKRCRFGLTATRT